MAAYGRLVRRGDPPGGPAEPHRVLVQGGLVPVRWMFVRDRDGRHRGEFFFTTDVALDPVIVIETYTACWNLETTFQELRSLLGLERTRGWCRKTMLRIAPCLFGLYTALALLYQALPEAEGCGRVEWLGKAGCVLGCADGGAAVAVAGVDWTKRLRRGMGERSGFSGREEAGHRAILV